MTYAPEYYGGGPTVTGTAVAVDANGAIYARVGSTAAIRVTCNQDVTLLDLTFTVETMAKTDVATVVSASITKNETYADLSLTSAMTASERTLRWSLVNDDNGEEVAGGLMFVTYDAQGDS